MRTKLSDEQISFCERLGLDRGVDIDDDETQFSHICWPHEIFRGALCRSPRLWGQGIGIDSDGVWCTSCLEKLHELQQKDAELLDVIGQLARRLESLRKVDSAAGEVIWARDNPEAAAKGILRGHPDPDLELREALANAHAEWVAIVQGASSK